MLLKEMVILEAGSRAVMVNGIMAPGGGSGHLERSSRPTDDFGKIDSIVDKIISNKLIPNISVNSSLLDGRELRALLNDMVEIMATNVIKYGFETNEFSVLEDKLLKNDILEEDILDDFVDKLEGKVKNHEILFISNLKAALLNAILKRNVAKSPNHLRLVYEIFSASLNELSTLYKFDSKQLPFNVEVELEQFKLDMEKIIEYANGNRVNEVKEEKIVEVTVENAERGSNSERENSSSFIKCKNNFFKLI
jgi:hypothetical protein